MTYSTYRRLRILVIVLAIGLVVWWGKMIIEYLTRPEPLPPPSRVETSITIIEGWTVDQIAQHVQKEQRISATTTAGMIGRSANRGAFDLKWRARFSFLRLLPIGRSLEGYLFPDTYRVWKDELPEALIEKQLAEFQDKFGTANVTKKSAPLKSLDEVIILASIVEREVQKSEDKKIVAGIFLNRLKDGMALQSDATLSYALGSNRARATDDDLKSTTPFNTYKFPGLPPAPISNPGADSINAVLNPTPSNYRYFLTDKEGTVLYARTFEEHGQNRRKAGY